MKTNQKKQEIKRQCTEQIKFNDSLDLYCITNDCYNRLKTNSVLSTMERESLCLVILNGDKAQELFESIMEDVDGYIYCTKDLPVLITTNLVQFFVRNFSHVIKHLIKIMKSNVDLMILNQFKVSIFSNKKTNQYYNSTFLIQSISKTFHNKGFIGTKYSIENLLFTMKSIDIKIYEVLKANKETTFVQSLSGFLILMSKQSIEDVIAHPKMVFLTNIIKYSNFEDIKNISFAYLFHYFDKNH
ncbi:hypothetical protein [Paracholeplasma manati]|uniref:hypothetical protein n=1 Tax=Paracholeplasma manati TaxID=591373 RepID=UPI0024083774|nr:hypothetical protein [Paracholeplasma manati]MDG0889651.1 hypothetical protein [Paracholeplasma manati]